MAKYWRNRVELTVVVGVFAWFLKLRVVGIATGTSFSEYYLQEVLCPESGKKAGEKTFRGCKLLHGTDVSFFLPDAKDSVRFGRHKKNL